jgi:hypothetical protein
MKHQISFLKEAAQDIEERLTFGMRFSWLVLANRSLKL